MTLKSSGIVNISFGILFTFLSALLIILSCQTHYGEKPFLASMVDFAPQTPYDLQPANGTINIVPDYVRLSWKCKDWNREEMTFDIYLGKSPDSLNFICPVFNDGGRTGDYQEVYGIRNLEHATNYYWKIIARDLRNKSTESPLMTFRTSGELRLIGEYRGLSGNRIVLRDNLIFGGFSDGNSWGFGILDISNPAIPLLFGSLATERYFKNLCLKNNYAYMIDSEDDIKIVDITDPANPQLGATIRLPYGNVKDIDSFGDYLYICMDGSVKIFDISNQSQPVFQTSYIFSDHHAISMKIYGDTALISYENYGIRETSLSNPLSPQLIHDMQLAGVFYNFTLSKSIIFLAVDAFGLKIADISGSGEGSLLSEYALYGGGNRYYDLEPRGEYLFLSAAASGLAAFSIADLLNPQLLDETTIEDQDMGDMLVSGEYIYIQNNAGSYGLKIYQFIP